MLTHIGPGLLSASQVNSPLHNCHFFGIHQGLCSKICVFHLILWQPSGEDTVIPLSHMTLKILKYVVVAQANTTGDEVGFQTQSVLAGISFIEVQLTW